MPKPSWLYLLFLVFLLNAVAIIHVALNYRAVRVGQASHPGPEQIRDAARATLKCHFSDHITAALEDNLALLLMDANDKVSWEKRHLDQIWHSIPDKSRQQVLKGKVPDNVEFPPADVSIIVDGKLKRKLRQHAETLLINDPAYSDDLADLPDRGAKRARVRDIWSNQLTRDDRITLMPAWSLVENDDAEESLYHDLQEGRYNSVQLAQKGRNRYLVVYGELLRSQANDLLGAGDHKRWADNEAYSRFQGIGDAEQDPILRMLHEAWQRLSRGEARKPTAAAQSQAPKGPKGFVDHQRTWKNSLLRDLMDKMVSRDDVHAFLDAFLLKAKSKFGDISYPRSTSASSTEIRHKCLQCAAVKTELSKYRLKIHPAARLCLDQALIRAGGYTNRRIMRADGYLIGRRKL